MPECSSALHPPSHPPICLSYCPPPPAQDRKKYKYLFVFTVCKQHHTPDLNTETNADLRSCILAKASYSYVYSLLHTALKRGRAEDYRAENAENHGEPQRQGTLMSG
ncbi:hypothetical protein STEG23_025870, partial [Scotinomys teguina]